MAQPSPTEPAPTPDDATGPDDLAHAHDLFARTLRFLSRCAEDPSAARATEDAQALIGELKALGAAPPAPASPDVDEMEADELEADEPKSLPLRRRRSA